MDPVEATLQADIEAREEALREENAITGWSSNYYQLPLGAKELQDLIEEKDMNFAVGNIFKACYRLGNKMGTTRKYDIEKIIWYAQRELDRIHKEEDPSPSYSDPPFSKVDGAMYRLGVDEDYPTNHK